MRTSDKDKRRGFVPLLGRAALAVFFCTAFLWRCATIMTPTGGPKDTLPPVITLMTPDNFTTNFKDRKIYIEFGRVRPDQGSAEGVLHLAADEEETHHHPARAGNLRSVARYAEGEYHLCAQFRQRDLRQQRGQPPLLDALRLFDRTPRSIRWCCRAIRSTPTRPTA